MAGRGPAPKMNRARRGAPARGDWKQLEPLTAPVLPALDDLPVPSNCNGEWPYTARVYWDAWRSSPVTALWTDDDKALAIDTIMHYARTCMFTKGDGGVPLPASELRIRQETLGLTPKGRKDNRLLLPEEAAPADLVPIHGGGDEDDRPVISIDRVIPEAI